MVIALLTSGAYAQSPAPQTRDTADFKIQVWGIASADFDARMLGLMIDA
jgi:hypothetical protein